VHQGTSCISAERDKGFIIHSRPILVAADQDRFEEQQGPGVSTITLKVIPSDSRDVLIIENTFHENGGPARHLHYEQDEWFYILEGEFIMEIGQDHFRLIPGDSILGPSKIPHVWAYMRGPRGRILIAFLPAGKMESFLLEKTSEKPGKRLFGSLLIQLYL
jgi:mannose-6-phosphate isomerase-like protein (cupin superfamily)